MKCIYSIAIFLFQLEAVTSVLYYVTLTISSDINSGLSDSAVKPSLTLKGADGKIQIDHLVGKFTDGATLSWVFRGQPDVGTISCVVMETHSSETLIVEVVSVYSSNRQGWSVMWNKSKAWLSKNKQMGFESVSLCADNYGDAVWGGPLVGGTGVGDIRVVDIVLMGTIVFLFLGVVVLTCLLIRFRTRMKNIQQKLWRIYADFDKGATIKERFNVAEEAHNHCDRVPFHTINSVPSSLHFTHGVKTSHDPPIYKRSMDIISDISSDEESNMSDQLADEESGVGMSGVGTSGLSLFTLPRGFRGDSGARDSTGNGSVFV